MNVPIRLPHKKTGWWALGISLMLHAPLAIALLSLRAPQRPPRETESADVCISLFEAKRPEISFDAAQPGAIVVTLTPQDPAVSQEPSGQRASNSANSGRGAGVHGASASNSQGAGASAGLFPAINTAKSVVYVIDRSSSMGFHGGLERVRVELLKSLEALPATTAFQVIVFNQTVRALIPDRVRLMPATPENRRAVAAALDELLPLGGTRHDDALPLALALGPDVIFFLTDADDLSEDYVRDITTRNRARSVIHTIELSGTNRQRTDMPLQLLARYNRGTYRAIDIVR